MKKGFEHPGGLDLRNRLKFLARDSFLYGSSSAFNKAFGLITFPVFARHLGIERYGVLDFYNVLAAALATLVIFGQDTAVARFFYDGKGDFEKRQCVSLSLGFQCVAVIIAVPIFWLARAFVIRTGIGGLEPEVIGLVVLQVPALVLLNFSQNILKWTFSAKTFVLITVGSSLVSLAAMMVGIIWWKIEVAGILAILLVVRLIFSLIGLWCVRGWLAVPRDRQLLWHMIKFAAPMGVICALGAVMPALERGLVGDLLGGSNLGLFAAGAKIAMLVSLPVQAFQVAWGPFSLALANESNADQTYNWVLKCFTVAVLGAVVFLTVFGSFLLELFASHQFMAASVVVFPIAMGLAVQGIGWVVSIGIAVSKRTYLNLYSYGVYSVVSVGATFFLVKVFGLVGAAWGGLLANVVRAGMEFYLAQGACRYSWQIRGVFVLSGLLVCWGLAFGLVQWSVWPLGTVFAALTGAVIFAVGSWCLFDQGERQRLVRVFKP